MPDRVVRTLVALAILLAGTAAIWATDQPAIRYGTPSGDRACLAHQMLELPSDPDVLFIGSSRVRSGFYPKVIAAKSDGAATKVYNLGRSSSSVDRSIAILGEMLERGVRPKLVMLEVVLERMASDKSTTRLDQAGFIRFADIPAAAERWEPPHRLPLVNEANIALTKLSNGLELMADGHLLRLRGLADAAPETVCERPNFLSAGPQQEKEKRRWAAKVLAANPDNSTTFEDRTPVPGTRGFRREFWQVETARALATQYGFKLVFTRLPEYLQRPLSAGAKKQVSELLPEFRYPPDELYRLGEDMFVDVEHLSREGGSRLASAWFAGVVKSELGGS